MIKNMTRKGLAIGAGISLMLTGLVGVAPAQAAAIEGFVDLEPAVGIKTAYATIAVDGATFDVRAAARGLANRSDANLKLVVSDPDQRVTSQTPVAREADGSFVINMGTAAAARTTGIALRSLSPAAQTSVTVTVQAIVDIDGNDEISSGDYVSPAREITFVTRGDLRAQATLAVPKVGDEKLIATLVTTPLLNWQQVRNNGSASADGLLAVVFNRQDSSVNGAEVITAANNATQALDGSLTAEISMAPNKGDNSLTAWVPTAGLGPISAVNDSWGFSVPDDRIGDARIATIEVARNRVVTVTTVTAHALRSGDKITMAVVSDPVAAAATTTARTITVVSERVFTYSTPGDALAAVQVTGATTNAATGYTVATYTASPKSLVERVFTGSYSAVAAIRIDSTDWRPSGTASAFAAQTLVADDVLLGTVASANVQGAIATKGAAGRATADVRVGTTAADVVATIVDDEGDAVGAGVLVSWNFTVGTSTSLRVNGLTAAAAKAPLFTDANGQVTFAVTDTNGSAGKALTLSVSAPGSAASELHLRWAVATVGMYDLNVAGDSALAVTATRSVLRGSSYPLQLLVSDQWFTPVADGEYQLAVSGGGVTSGFVAVTSGRATITVSDSGVLNSYVSNITLQRKGTTGVFANTTTAVAVTTNIVTSARVTLGANGSGLFAGTTVKLSDAVAEKALVERDTRTAFAVQPAYVNAVVIAGAVTSPTTGVAQAHSVVTVSGPSNVLFSSGAVDKRGSITLVADNNGQFAVTLYSTTAQEDTVITVTSSGATATTKVTFTGIGAGEGTAIAITAPSNVAPASTFQVKAKLSDQFGNGVTAGEGRMRVTYTGPGIVFGTLPTSTDANGELMFSVLLGANDTGSITVRVQYDKNGNGVFTDAVDLSATSTTTIGAGSGLTGQARAWTRFITADNELKIYARDVVGAGKVQFIVNGREIAWVRAVDGTDPKLNVASDGMVRSVKVADMLTGRNVIEIVVNDERVVRRIFTK